MTDLIRVLIADDHFVVRQGVATVLVPRNGMEVVGEAANGSEAVTLARQLQPDVILMDLVMPVVDGLQAIQAILKETPDAKILVLTSFGDYNRILSAIRAGARGFLLKDSSRDELLDAIGHVADGKMWLPADIATMAKAAPPAWPQPILLTPRETEVLKSMARGLSNQEIAEELGIGVNTVNTHVKSLYAKLGINNRTQATRYAVDHGLTT